jgi:glycosyltransferase involved in cell wall biosynthesis
MPYPLISCVMPTCNRREFIPSALKAFEAQSYPNRELIVVDNGESVADLIPDRHGYFYTHTGVDKLTTGAMRNKACELATGEIVAHWDDDDYSHPDRLKEQYKLLQSMCVSVVGYNEMYFLDETASQAWLYRNEDLYALGTSLMYKRDYWRGHRFPDQAVGEDSDFIRPAQWRRAMACRAAGNRLIARIHGANTCDKRPYMSLPMWQSVPFSFVTDMIRCITQS